MPTLKFLPIRPDNRHPKFRHGRTDAAAACRGVIGGFVAGLPLLLVVLPALMRRIYR